VGDFFLAFKLNFYPAIILMAFIIIGVIVADKYVGDIDASIGGIVAAAVLISQYSVQKSK